MRTFSAVRLISASLLASTAIAAPALAQNAGTETQTPQRQTLDENGVDPATGQQVTYVTELSIGPQGPGGLHLVRGRGHGRNESSMAFLLSGNPTVEMYATAGLRTVTFAYAGGAYQPTDGSSATLVRNSTNQWTLTLEDGTVVVYNYQGFNDTYDGRGTSVTYPTGERLALSYRSVEYCTTTGDTCSSYAYATRIQGIASSLGYLLHYDYARDADPIFPGQGTSWKRLVSIKAINTTIDPCDVAADDCSTTQNWPTVGYDTTGGVTDPAGHTWRYTASTTQFKIRRPGSSSDNIVVNIDATSQRVTSVQRDGMTWTYAWSGFSLLTMTRTDPLGKVFKVVSDTNLDVPTQVTDELNRVTTHTYDTSGRLTKTTPPEGNSVEYAYDSRGNVTQVKQVAKPNTGLADIVTSATYPATCPNPRNCNLPTTTTDARGNVTDYAWNSNGDALTITLPAPATGAVRPQSRYTYTNVTTPSGTVVSKLQSVSQCQTQASCAGTADEAKTSFAWSNQLLLTGITLADGTGALSATTTITNDGVGNPKTIDGPLNGTADTTTLRYDNLRRVVGTISPDPDGAGPLKMRAVKTTYHPAGGVQKIETGTVNGTTDADWTAIAVLETQTIDYDSAARPSVLSLAGSDGVVQAKTQLSYDAVGRPECSAVRMNPAVYGSLPASACTLGTQGSLGADRILKTVYNAASEVTEQRVAVGTADEAAERTLSYTSNGMLATLKDAENNLTTYEYDGHDRLSKTRFPVPTKGANQSSTTDYEQSGYDAASNVTSFRNRAGETAAFTWDNLNRRTLKDLPGSEPDVSYAYDNLGRLTSASQTGNSLSFTYDALSRNLTQVGPQGTVASQWDLAGRRTRLTYPGTGLYVDYDYLGTGEVTKIRENGATSGIGVLATFAYDDLGRRTGLTFGNGVVQGFAYDPVSRLASLTNDIAGTANDLSATFAYNPATQITSTTRTGDPYAWTGHFNENKTGTPNGLNQLSQYGGKSLTHDSKGNVTAFGAKSFTYSSENLLLTGPNSTSLSYDPVMRLQQVTSGATSRFAYDGLDRIAEYDGSNALQRRYVHGPSVDNPIIWYEGSGTSDRRFLSSDERGSVIAVTDSSGAVLGLNKYDEFGQPQSGNLGGFGYTGQAWLPSLGLWHYKARVYDSELGRFLQPDPIGYADSPNLYAYVLNDPVNLVDPLGLQEDITVTHWRYRPPEMAISGASSGIGGLFGGEPRGRDIEVVGARPRRKTSRRITRQYTVHQFTRCSASEAFNMLLEPGMSAPFAPRARPGVTTDVPVGIPLFGVNRITQVVSLSTLTILNIAQSGHRYYPGTVELRATPITANTSMLTATGVGYGSRAFENEWITGRPFFGQAITQVGVVCAIKFLTPLR